MKLEKTYLNCFLLAEFHSGSWDSNVVRTKIPKNVAGFVIDFWRNEVQNSAGAEHPKDKVERNVQI